METRDSWGARWKQNRLGFHQNAVSPGLEQFGPQAFPAGSRVFLPLCGKTLDLVHLARRGHGVVGVEFVEMAVRAFFVEQDIAHEQISTAPLTLEGGGIRLIADDVFDVAAAQLGKVDGVFDRAALVAINPADRVRYADLLIELLPAGGKILLVTFDYDQNEMSGPPFSVGADLVESLFADHEITLLDEADALGANPKFAQRGLTALRVQTYAIEKT